MSLRKKRARCVVIAIFAVVETTYGGENTASPFCWQHHTHMATAATPCTDALVATSHDVCRDGVTTHGVNRIAVSFNGGKDSMVMLQLIIDAIGLDTARKLTYFVFDNPDDFDELRAFRDMQVKTHGLKLITVARDMKEGLWQLHRDLGLSAAFLGVREDDPSGKWITAHATPCTEGWPPMTLFCPVLRWKYADVWAYTHERSVPFCTLYADGYTSLGSKQHTVPNPALYDTTTESHRPAWMLNDGSQERCNRATATTTTTTAAV